MKRPYVQLIKYLYQLHHWCRHQLIHRPTKSNDEILTQDYSDQAQSAFAEPSFTNRSRPKYPAQIGLVGLVVIVTWWGLPAIELQNPLALLTSYSVKDLSSQRSLAVINPLNLLLTNQQQPTSTAAGSPLPAPEDAGQRPAFPVVIVTPTAAARIQILDPNQSEDNRPAQSQSSTISLRPQVVIVTGSKSNADSSAAGADASIAGQSPISDTDSLVIEIDIPGNSLSEPVHVVPVAVERQRVESSGSLQPQVFLVPTATATQPPPEPDYNIPAVEIIPAVGVKQTPRPDPPTPVPTPTELPTPVIATSGPGRIWSSFTPRPAPESDHFWISSPFPVSIANDSASPNYQFGSTAGGRYRPHHGVDISNPLGTPVQAGIAGTIVHAGSDQEIHLGPYGNFYGRAVVIRLDQRLPVAGGEMDVFLLYGHLSEVRAEVGQHVEAEDIVGLVGMTGIAIGPHLHVEVRLGANLYSHTVNPWLWLKPKPGHGAVAVRLLTADGRTWAGAKISIARFVNGSAVWGRQIETYLDTERIGPDPAWGENGAMGDVPAGYYYLVGNVNGESIRAEFEVADGETTFVEIRTSR